MPKRGIVLTPDIGLDFGFGPLVCGSVSPKDLRRILLYWDQVCIPALVSVGPEPGISSLVRQTSFADEELELLNQESILTCFEIDCGTTKEIVSPDWGDFFRKFNPKDILQALYSIQTDAVNELNRTTKHIWVMGRIRKMTDEEPNDITLKYSPVIELLDCVPSPSPETPLEEIIEFKGKREYELMRFRTALDALVRAVEEAEDAYSAIKLAEEEIERALVGLHRVLDETRIQKIVGKLSVWVNLKDASALNILFPALGVAGAGILSIPKELGALAGLGINAAIAVFARQVPKIHGLPADLQGYFYLYEAEKLQDP